MSTSRTEAAATTITPLPLPVGNKETGRPVPRRRLHDQRGRLLRRLLLVADVTALCVAFLAGEAISQVVSYDNLPLLLLSIPLWILLAHAHRLYHLDSHRADYRAADEIGAVLQMATLWSWGTLLALSALRPDHVPVPQVALFWLVTVVLLMTLRSAARAYARRRVWYRQNALVVGPPGEAAAIVRKILRHPEWGINVAACVDFPGSSRFPARTTRLFDLVPFLRGEADLAELATSLDVDRVMLAPALSASRSRVEVVCELAEIGVHVDLVPSWSDVVGARLDLHEMEGMPLLTVPRTGLRRSSLRLKRALDVIGGAIGLAVLFPLLVICAIAIKLDSPGPVLFRQRRIGRDDRPFELLKFRSMYIDADARKEEVASQSFHGGGNELGMFKIREDPRVTPVGRVLRRYSLDEFPQLLNIVRGEMSFVGPRPLIENEDRQVEGRFRRRLSITPGLTGLWQAHGRSDIPFEQMVSLDYLYVTNWSLWGDVKLVMRTLSAVFRGSGAY
jgi:exopolysaccharide biosynthesis polyprenyl glycosylphosphotransferase